LEKYCEAEQCRAVRLFVTPTKKRLRADRKSEQYRLKCAKEKAEHSLTLPFLLYLSDSDLSLDISLLFLCDYDPTVYHVVVIKVDSARI